MVVTGLVGRDGPGRVGRRNGSGRDRRAGRRQKKRICKVVQGGAGVAGDDDGLEIKRLSSDQAQLVGEQVDAVGGGADQAMLPGDQAQQRGQLEVTELVHLAQQRFIRHWGAALWCDPSRGDEDLGRRQLGNLVDNAEE